MITTLEQFKEAALELCKKYDLSNEVSCEIDNNNFLLRHKEIYDNCPFKGRIAEDVLKAAEKFIAEIKYCSFF